jgi:hypothetical protein
LVGTVEGGEHVPRADDCDRADAAGLLELDHDLFDRPRVNPQVDERMAG